MKQQILELHNQGLSGTEISKRLNCATSTVSYHLGNKDKSLSRQRIRRKEKKKELVDYKGSKCEKCGYDKCLDALEFHHINPEEKEFTISVSKNYNMESLYREVDKCQLLCSNCHKEVHSEIRDRRII